MDFGENFRKISIFSKISKNLILFKFSKNLAFGQNFSKNFDFSPIFEKKFEFGQNIRKFPIFWNFRKI